MVKLRGLSALEAWTRRVTAGYKDVNVSDLSSSWRDGLAFCALIHHFRPDLIDFDSLSKHNVLYNHRLAFGIAEKHLNVSALLDAEDMLKNDRIDPHSVATYLSQFYECFEGLKSDDKPTNSSQLNNRNFDTNTDTINSTAATDTNHRKSVANDYNITTPSHPPLPPKRDMRCQKCKLRVFILERIVIDDLIYHKSCYDSLDNDNNNGDRNNRDLDNRNGCANDGCDQLNSDYNSKLTLNSVCDPIVNTGVDMGVTVVSERNDAQIVDRNTIDMTLNNKTVDEQSNDQNELKCKTDVKFDSEDVTRSENQSIDEELDDETLSSLHYADNNDNIGDNSSDCSTCQSSLDNNEDKSLNTSIDKSLDTTDVSVSSVKYYPTDKNPFGDEDETEVEIEEKRNKLYPIDLNPFGDEDEVSISNPQLSGSKHNTPIPVPRRSVLNISDKSPSASLRLSPRKKRTAPTPPSVTKITQNTGKTISSSNLISNEFDESRRDSMSSSVSSELPSSVPSSRAPTPLPRIKLQKSFDDLSNSSQNQANSSITDKSQDSIRSNETESENKNTFGYWKAKKRPAPPIPAVKRVIKGSIAQIEDELNIIGDHLPIIEKRSNELEKAILNRESDDKLSLETDKSLKEFLTTAREKCRLARRQKELMYMKREHKLEEIQADVEYKMRIVMSKQSAQKTEDDQKKEEELLQRLVEIIEERNDIVENMIKDENKEVEEYRALLSKVVPSDQLNNYITKTGGKVKEVPNGDKSLVGKQQHKKGKHKDKEKRKQKNESAVNESVESRTVSPKEAEVSKKEKHFTLGKSTLKRLGLKPDKDKANKKKT